MRKKLHEEEKELQHQKKTHKNLVGALKKHFKSDESHEKSEMEHERSESDKEEMSEHKKMPKSDRKRIAVLIMKKKMKG